MTAGDIEIGERYLKKSAQPGRGAQARLARSLKRGRTIV